MAPRRRENRTSGLYIIASNAFGFDSPEDFGFDAICEFPPHGLEVPEIKSRLTPPNPNYDGRVYDYADVVSVEIEKLTARRPTALPRFPSVMPSWDNEPRTPGKGHVFHGATPSLFHKWFNRAAEYATQNFPPEERLVFINAWNEWAEGAYLEPDRRYGYANLAAVGNVVRRFNSDAASLCVRAFDHNRMKTKTSETALCFHIFYADLVTEVAEAIRKIKHQRPVDIIVSILETWSPSDLDRLIEEIDPLKLLVCSNIGRDVWPFIQSLRRCLDMGYIFGCKLHSKKSLHVADGTEWRQRLFSGLLSKKVLVGLESTFFADETCGLAAPENSFRTLRDPATVFHNERNMRMLMSRLGCRDPIFEGVHRGYYVLVPVLRTGKASKARHRRNLV